MKEAKLRILEQTDNVSLYSICFMAKTLLNMSPLFRNLRATQRLIQTTKTLFWL